VIPLVAAKAWIWGSSLSGDLGLQVLSLRQPENVMQRVSANNKRIFFKNEVLIFVIIRQTILHLYLLQQFVNVL